VYCATGLVLAKDNPSVCVGGIRIVVSMEGVNRQFRLIVTVLTAVVLIFFLVIVFSGLYFIRSIVSPIQGISERARKIALGDFESRIEVDAKRKDEITDLC
jgi:nitrogen fixation/metabolism regulation signal transduction histidine kinase